MATPADPELQKLIDENVKELKLDLTKMSDDMTIEFASLSVVEKKLSSLKQENETIISDMRVLKRKQDKQTEQIMRNATKITNLEGSMNCTKPRDAPPSDHQMLCIQTSNSSFTKSHRSDSPTGASSNQSFRATKSLSPTSSVSSCQGKEGV